jgi:hypothetical protein
VNPEASFGNTTSRNWFADPAGQLDPRLDCNLQNPLANGSCGPTTTPTFGLQTTPLTTYDPSIVTGWGVRPYNWELQASIQQQVAPRVSVYAGYSRRWFGNLTATQNTAVTNASFTSYCIPIPTAPAITGFAMPNGGSQQCGYFDLVRPTTAVSVIQLASNFGKVQDVYDGFDFDANARLGRGILVNGGVSIGRERVNACDLKDNLQISAVGFGAVTAGFGSNTPRDTAYCDVRPPFQPNVKGQIAYPFPWGIGGSLSFQSLAGAQITASYPLTNTTPGLTLGRNFSSVAPSVQIVAPGTQYLDRIYQTDIRLSKTIKYRSTTIRPTMNVFNLFNSNKTNTNNAYTTTYTIPTATTQNAWLAPTVILTPRFVDFGVQIDF